MYESKEEIAQQLRHQQELLRIQRSNLQKLQLQEANYAGNPPLDLQNQLDRVAEQVRSTEDEIARLKSVAAEDQLSLVEAEYRTLLAEAWNTPLGRPTVAGATRLEFTRLKFGLSPERAGELEREIRTKLAEEIFNTLDMAPILGQRGDVDSRAIGQIAIEIRAGDGSNISFYNVDINQAVQIDTSLEISLKRIGCAIRLDPATALQLFVRFLPLDASLDLAAFGAQLLGVNKVTISPTDNTIFQQFLTNLVQVLSTRILPSNTGPE